MKPCLFKCVCVLFLVCFVGVEGRPHHSTKIKKQNVFLNQEESSIPASADIKNRGRRATERTCKMMSEFGTNDAVAAEQNEGDVSKGKNEGWEQRRGQLHPLC